MMEMVDSYRDKFESVAIAEPLLGEVGSDATVINADKELSPRPSPLRPSRPPVSTVWTPLLRTAPPSSSWATAPPTPQR